MANVHSPGPSRHGLEQMAIDPREWVGGVFSMPTYVEDEVPYRPDALVWASEDGFVIGVELLQRGAGAAAIRDNLLKTMRAPSIGEPRRPKRIRVATEELREALRAMGEPFDVVVAPTPEVDALADDVRDFYANGGPEASGLGDLTGEDDHVGPSYLEGGRISEAAVASFFEVAGRLWRAAPWDIVPDDRHVLGVDIPSLGVKAKCLSIVGQAGESFGFILFESLRAQRAFVHSAGNGRESPGFGCTTLSVTFDRAEDVPDEMLDEIDEHGWPLPAPDRHPSIIHLDPDGVPRPQTPEDVAVATATASALERFFAEHPRWSETAPRSGRYLVPEAGPDVEVTLTAPCPDPDEPVARGARAQRGGGTGKAGKKDKRRKGAAGRAVGALQATSETALSRLVHELWGPEFETRFPAEVDDAVGEIIAARLGGTVDEGEQMVERLASLPYVWASFWRPLEDGRTGVDIAAGSSVVRPPVLAAALERVRAARVVYGEIAAVDLVASIATVRDLWDGASYRVEIPAVIARAVTHRTRCFTILVEVASDCWMHPSIFVASELFASVTPADLVDALRQALTRLGEDCDDIKPESSAGRATMLRWAGVFGAVVHWRLEAAQRERHRDARNQPRRF